MILCYDRHYAWIALFTYHRIVRYLNTTQLLVWKVRCSWINSFVWIKVSTMEKMNSFRNTAVVDARLLYTLRFGTYLPFTDHVCVYKLYEWCCRTWTSLAKIFSGLIMIRYTAFIKMMFSLSVCVMTRNIYFDIKPLPANKVLKQIRL